MERGRAFEQEVQHLLENELNAGSLGLNPRHATVYHRKSYFSLQRSSKIIVDISIEVCWAKATEPYLIWIWECKDYRHPVPIDDIEEFHAKLQQIGADRTKGTVVTRSKFQKAAVNYAKSNGIGLARVVPESRSIKHVAYCMSWVEQPSDDEIAAGLLAGRRAQIGSSFYAITSTGAYAYELSQVLKNELRIT